MEPLAFPTSTTNIRDVERVMIHQKESASTTSAILLAETSASTFLIELTAAHSTSPKSNVWARLRLLISPLRDTEAGYILSQRHTRRNMA